MINLKQMHKHAEEIERRLRLQTSPLAIKLLEKEAQIPEEAIRPKRDYGRHLALCQGFQLSRREGAVVAMLKEDMWCFEPVVGYGLAEPPEYFMEGHNRFPMDVESLEAGRNYALEFPRLETGKYIGVMSAPLITAGFEPDAVMVYCNSAQLCILLLGKEYKDGRNLSTALSGHAVCVYAIVPAIQNRTYQVAIPCRGDRVFGMASDDELVFTIPIEKLEDLTLGLSRIAETAMSNMPMIREIKPEPKLPENYMKIGKMLGIEASK